MNDREVLCRDRRQLDEHYSLIPVDSAPLPPHERTWRHPSELAATTHEVDNGRQPRGVALAGGALALMMVAAMVVALSPQQAPSTTTALSATTIPTAASVASTANVAVIAAESIRTSRLAGITAIPQGIANVPPATVRSSVAGEAMQAILPDLDDRVTVLTDQFVYAVAWRDVTRIDITADAVVVDGDGVVVAHIVDGRLVVSHDLLVGAVISLD